MSVNSFWTHAEANPDHQAIIEDDGATRSAGELLAASNQVAHGLRALGVKKGDTVAIVMANDSAMLEVALAAGQTGVYVTPINHHLTASEVGFILQDCGAQVVVCSIVCTLRVERWAALPLVFPLSARDRILTSCVCNDMSLK